VEVGGLPLTLATSPRVQSPGAYCVRSQVDPRASWDILEKRKVFLSLLGFKRQTAQLIAFSLYWLLYPSSESHRDCTGVKPRPL